MVQSMTGFGRAEGSLENKKITVEIRSLNSKNMDLNLKMPSKFRDQEFSIRKLLTERLQRGKIDCYINTEHIGETGETAFNPELLQQYISQLKNIAGDGPDFEYLKMAVRFPDAITSRKENVEESENHFLLALVEEAIEKFQNFRKAEGENQRHQLDIYINNIGNLLQKVDNYEAGRIETVRERFEKALKDFEIVDETRFYQEMAFYTEKLDISEEKVRLAQHLNYFLMVMDNEDFNGKKLGFITQEIGREINTLGSKANHSEIQKIVVEMKDELEKIKEQTLNIL